MFEYSWTYNHPKKVAECMEYCFEGHTEFNIKYCYSCEFYDECEALDALDALGKEIRAKQAQCKEQDKMPFAEAIEITKEQFDEMLFLWQEDNKSVQEEQFWFFNDNVFCTVDNRDYEFFVEEWNTPEAASAWLRGMEIDCAMRLDKMVMEMMGGK